MTPNWIGTYAAKAAAKVLDLFRPCPPAADQWTGKYLHSVLSYRDNFHRLWQFDPALVDWLNQPNRIIVIVWDETPRDTKMGLINTCDYLSPLEWAVCAAKHSPKIHVVVLDVRMFRHGGSILLDLQQAIKAEHLPCLRLVSLNDWCSGAASQCMSPSSEATSRERLEMMDLLAQQIRLRLTASGDVSDHHSIVNIVAPMVLMQDRLDPSGTLHSAPLLELFRGVGLIDARPVSVRQVQNTSPLDCNQRGADAVRILLVDDQADHGWLDWLCSVISPTVEKSTTPDILIHGIRGVIERNGGLDSRFTLRFDSTTNAQNGLRDTILLLDLRLFSLRPLAEEVSFLLVQLLPLCRQFIERTTGPRFSWRGFTQAELDRVARWCERPVKNSDTHLLALTLLPRLIALTDCSLPIILFSSTGQRSIIERLKDYGNIITDFEKPRFAGSVGPEVVSETHAKLKQALDRACGLLVARRKCRRLEGIIKEHPEYRTRDIGSPMPSTTPPDRYLELYLDERENESEGLFSIGGCFALFEAGPIERQRGTLKSLADLQALDAAAVVKADRFDDWLVTEKGIRYFDNRKVGPSALSGLLKKKRSGVAKELKDYRKSDATPSQLGLLRLTLQSRQQEGAGEATFALSESDNTFRVALKELLDLFFAETMPALLGDEQEAQNILVSVFAGARMTELRAERGRAAAFKFGIRESQHQAEHFYTLSRSEVYPVAMDVLEARCLRRKVHRLIAVSLPYDREPGLKLPEFFVCRSCREIIYCSSNDPLPSNMHHCALPDVHPDYRALHYVADEVLARFPTASKRTQYDEIFNRTVVPGEFDDVLDHALRISLEASRDLDRGDLVSAIARVQIPDLPRFGNKPTARFWISRRIAARLHELTGADFVRLADRTRMVESA